VEVHPVAEMFPMLTDEELETLAEDIRENGLRQPITVYEGQVLDGRNRLKACELADVEPVFVEYEGDDPIAFIVSLNLQRRHLEVGQRAAIGHELRGPLEKEARSRMREGGLRGLEVRWGSGRASTDARVERGLPENKAAFRAAVMVGVSGIAVERASRLATHAPDLFAEVKRGDISLSRATMILQQRQAGIADVASSNVTDWRPSYRVREDIGNSQASADEVMSGTGANWVAENLNLMFRMAEVGFLPTDTQEARNGLAALVKRHVDYVVPRLVATYVEGTE